MEGEKDRKERGGKVRKENEVEKEEEKEGRK